MFKTLAYEKLESGSLQSVKMLNLTNSIFYSFISEYVTWSDFINHDIGYRM